MNSLFKSKKQAIIATAAFIALIMLVTAGTIFALTASNDVPDKPAAGTKQTEPAGQDVHEQDNPEQTEPTNEVRHSPAGDAITLDEAKAIALQDAGLKESQVQFYNVKLTQDDGIRIYEVEFYYNHREYEYEIKASDGTILDLDIDYDDDFEEDDDDDD